MIENTLIFPCIQSFDCQLSYHMKHLYFVILNVQFAVYTNVTFPVILHTKCMLRKYNFIIDSTKYFRKFA